TLYVERVEYIQDAGATRIRLWSEWYDACLKVDRGRNDKFVEACVSTIVFVEEDYIKRKLDFVTEVYALLEMDDPVLANQILNDLEILWTWKKDEFILKLEI
ncbi:hypothetical protein EK21DRAFT_65261, partial [Setomelanomma holmii]